MADTSAPQGLVQFTLAETPDGYLIEIEGERGDSLAVSVTAEQIDAIIDALDDVLSVDEAAADEVGPEDDAEDDAEA